MPYSDLLRGRVSINGQIYLVTTVTNGRERLFTNLSLTAASSSGRCTPESTADMRDDAGVRRDAGPPPLAATASSAEPTSARS